ncbi:MAG: hypothetical protein V3T42_05865, partial [Nitrospirales bacterium]
MGRTSTSNQGLTLKDLSGRISKNFFVSQAKVARVLQTWITAGVVVPEGDVHQGVGIYRTFKDSELYKAALIFDLTRYSFPIHRLCKIRFMIDRELKKNPGILAEAAQGKEWYLWFSFLPGKLYVKGILGEDPMVGEFIQKPYNEK